MRNILIIHEVKSIQSLLKRFIASELNDSSVTVASDPDEAFQLLNSETFNIAIAGNIMKHWDGTDILKEVRSSKKNKEIPFILIASSVTNESIERFKKAGIDNLLQSPFTATKLAETINEVCNPRAWRSHDRFVIPNTRAVVHYQHGDIEGPVVNLSAGGFLCDVTYEEGCHDLLFPSRVSLLMPTEYGNVKLHNIPCALLRLQVVESTKDYKPKILRLVWRFLDISKENHATLAKLLQKASSELENIAK